jgi:hypothetical protein
MGSAMRADRVLAQIGVPPRLNGSVVSIPLMPEAAPMYRMWSLHSEEMEASPSAQDERRIG